MRRKKTVVSGEQKVAVAEDNSGRWADLRPEILLLILATIPLDEIVRTVSLVCKAWMEAVSEYFLLEIDAVEWCRRHCRMCSTSVDIVVLKLMRWSNNMFQRLSAYGLGNPGFIFVAIRYVLCSFVCM